MNLQPDVETSNTSAQLLVSDYADKMKKTTLDTPRVIPHCAQHTFGSHTTAVS